MGLDQKDFVNELKIEWKRLWNERLDDKLRAEGIAINDYSQLFIDKGTIIHATRDFKALSFKEILKIHEIANADRYIPPNPQIGGWKKFVKDNISNKKFSHRKTRAKNYEKEKVEKQQLKKGGRGWLHV